MPALDEVHVIGKGRRERILPLWKETRSALRDWLAVRPKSADRQADPTDKLDTLDKWRPPNPPESQDQGRAGRVARDARRHLNPTISWEPDSSKSLENQRPKRLRFPES